MLLQSLIDLAQTLPVWVSVPVGTGVTYVAYKVINTAYRIIHTGYNGSKRILSPFCNILFTRDPDEQTFDTTASSSVNIHELVQHLYNNIFPRLIIVESKLNAQANSNQDIRDLTEEVKVLSDKLNDTKSKHGQRLQLLHNWMQTQHGNPPDYLVEQPSSKQKEKPGAAEVENLTKNIVLPGQQYSANAKSVLASRMLYSMCRLFEPVNNNPVTANHPVLLRYNDNGKIGYVQCKCGNYTFTTVSKGNITTVVKCLRCGNDTVPPVYRDGTWDRTRFNHTWINAYFTDLVESV